MAICVEVKLIVGVRLRVCDVVSCWLCVAVWDGVGVRVSPVDTVCVGDDVPELVCVRVEVAACEGVSDWLGVRP